MGQHTPAELALKFDCRRMNVAKTTSEDELDADESDESTDTDDDETSDSVLEDDDDESGGNKPKLKER